MNFHQSSSFSSLENRWYLLESILPCNPVVGGSWRDCLTMDEFWNASNDVALLFFQFGRFGGFLFNDFSSICKYYDRLSVYLSIP